MYICQSYLSTEVSGRHTQSTQPDLQTQVSPRRMQSLTSRASSVSSLTPASRSPRLAPGLSPTSVVRILTWPLMNSDSHPSVFSVEDSSLDQPVVTLFKLFYVNFNVYLTNHMTPPMSSPPIMFSDRIEFVSTSTAQVRSIILITTGALLKALCLYHKTT